VQQNEVFFQVSNSIGDQLPMKNSSGTGLKNVKKRLELLFKNKYDLQLISENSVYIATLRLDLN
jgi:LytS/YehU family sensor histidine kinase